MDAATVLTHTEIVSLLTHIIDAITIRDTAEVTKGLGWVEQIVEAEQIILCRTVIEKNRPPVLDRLFNYSFKNSWVDTYIRKDYADVDPILARAQVTEGFFEWEILERQSTDRRGRQFAEDAVANGLSTGVTVSVPVHKEMNNVRVVCSLANVAPLRKAAARTILDALIPVFSLALGWETMPITAEDVQITAREKDVLRWASIGKSVWEISQILRISESTVKFHLQNIYRKLNVTSRSHAITKAMSLGIL